MRDLVELSIHLAELRRECLLLALETVKAIGAMPGGGGDTLDELCERPRPSLPDFWGTSLALFAAPELEVRCVLLLPKPCRESWT